MQSMLANLNGLLHCSSSYLALYI